MAYRDNCIIILLNYIQITNIQIKEKKNKNKKKQITCDHLFHLFMFCKRGELFKNMHLNRFGQLYAFNLKRTCFKHFI